MQLRTASLRGRGGVQEVIATRNADADTDACNQDMLTRMHAG
jgi:hypothetical protein